MNDRQKLAALLLRLIGGGFAVLDTFFISFWYVEHLLGVATRDYPFHTFVGNVIYILFGLLLVLVSKPLGRLLGRGLE